MHWSDRTASDHMILDYISLWMICLCPVTEGGGCLIGARLTGQCQTRGSSITVGGDKRRSRWGRSAGRSQIWQSVRITPASETAVHRVCLQRTCSVFVIFWHTHVRLFHTHHYINLEATLKSSTMGRLNASVANLNSLFFIAATQNDPDSFQPDSLLLK